MPLCCFATQMRIFQESLILAGMIQTGHELSLCTSAESHNSQIDTRTWIITDKCFSWKIPWMWRHRSNMRKIFYIYIFFFFPPYLLNFIKFQLYNKTDLKCKTFSFTLRAPEKGFRAQSLGFVMRSWIHTIQKHRHSHTDPVFFFKRRDKRKLVFYGCCFF